MNELQKSLMKNFVNFGRWHIYQANCTLCYPTLDKWSNYELFRVNNYPNLNGQSILFFAPKAGIGTYIDDDEAIKYFKKGMKYFKLLNFK